MKKELFLLAILTTLFSRPYLSAQDTSGLAIDQPRFEQLMKKKRTVVVDVRTLGEFESGYVGYAINYDVMDSLSFVRSVESLDKRKKCLLYCKSGRRSGKALVMMKNMGFRKVHHLRGGVTEWKGELHKPMEK